ncbi:MAG: hypothetical protein RLZZ511_127 [Cyanobacteriota bacterium]|jgi:hypothetical protein
MSHLQSRYDHLIDNLVQTGLRGTLRSGDHIYSRIADELEPTTEALFNQCLDQRLRQIETQLQESGRDGRAQAQAQRQLQTLQTIQREWQRYQREINSQDIVAHTLFQLSNADAAEQMALLTSSLSPKASNALPLPHLEQLARNLASAPCQPDNRDRFRQYAKGIEQGIQSWKNIDRYLVSWLYQPRSPGQAAHQAKSPWALWSIQAIGPLTQQLFDILHRQESVEAWISTSDQINLSNWLELILVLQRAQQGLLRWAHQQPYNEPAAQQLISALYLGFASTWVQLGQGLGRCASLNSQTRAPLSQSAVTIGRQMLQTFTQHPQFPLYGNAQHTPENKTLCNALRYLSPTLNHPEAQTEKARILTLVGSLVILSGKCQEAEKLHQQALDLAQSQDDTVCMVANLNHLSRIATMQSQCSIAIEQAQRALILARQVGDVQGEANALTHLGAASAHQAQLMEAPIKGYETAMEYLMSGIDKAQDIGDQRCEGICANALANLCIQIGHPAEGLKWLQTGFQASNTCGDLYLQARHFTSMAQACQQVAHPGDAIYAACLGLYYFDQINWRDWRQPAALLTQLKQRLGDRFDQLLSQELAEIIRQIGSDGFAQITRRLEEYATS